MSSTVKSVVNDDSSLYRDESNRAIINSNTTDYHRRLAVKNAAKKKDHELKELKAEIAQLKELVNQLLTQRTTLQK